MTRRASDTATLLLLCSHLHLYGLPMLFLGCQCPDTAEVRSAALDSSINVGTWEEDSTLVISDANGIANVIPNLPPGTHTVTSDTTKATVSKISRLGRRTLIESVTGIEHGYQLWSSNPQQAGWINLPQLPVTLAHDPDEWLLVPSERDKRVTEKRRLSVSTRSLNALGKLDFFVRVAQNGQPVASAFGINTSLTSLSSPEQADDVKVSGWTTSPDMAELTYWNSTGENETVSLGIDMVRGNSWVGWGNAHANATFELGQGERGTIADTFDSEFHDLVLFRARKSIEQGYSERRVPRPAVHAPLKLELSSDDIPSELALPVWHAKSKQIAVELPTDLCGGLPIAMVQVNLFLRNIEGGETIDWKIISPPSDRIMVPSLPREFNVVEALSDPSFSATVAVEVLAVNSSYEQVVGLSGSPSAQYLAKDSCLLGRSIEE